MLVALGAAAAGLGGCAQAGPLAGGCPLEGWPAQPATLPSAWQHDVADPASGRTWRVWVQRPPGPAPVGGHPVFYLLDGNAAFAIAAQLAFNHAGRPEALRSAAPVVVGIGHPTGEPYANDLRQRDYTPAYLPASRAASDRGGADRLLDFLQHELQPRLHAGLPLDPRRQTLFGHSFGGLFALHALFTRPALFTRYAAASPSLWWEEAGALREAEAFAGPAPGGPLRLMLRVGGLETAEAAANPQRAAVQRERRMIAHARTVADRLAALPRLPGSPGSPGSSVHVDFAVLPGLDHGSVMLPALAEALALAQRP